MLSFILTFSISCTQEIPDPCDCAKNALKFETPEHDKPLQQRCEEYGATLEGEEKEQRAAKGMECVKEFLEKMQVPHNH